MLHQIVEYLQRFGDFWYLDASIFKTFVFVVKSCSKMHFLKKETPFEEFVQDIHSSRDLNQWDIACSKTCSKADEEKVSDRSSMYSWLIPSHSRPFDKRCKNILGVICYGVCTETAEDSRTSFMQNKHNTVSCKIRIFPRESKCSSDGM